MFPINKKAIGLALVGIFALQAHGAENWPQWRGPDANGVARGEGYPVKWSQTDNVVWKFPLPGIGASTPILWEDSLILTGGHDGKNAVLCLDRTGKKRWEVTLSDEVRARNRKASGSNSSPVTDGESIFVYFKSGELACLDFSGKIVWKKNLQDEYGEDTLWWDLGTSPVLTKKLVIVACMQSGSSYIAGFDKETGKEAWKSDRNVESPGESAQSYTTPLVMVEGERELIVTLGADHVTAHDAADGKQVWVAGNLNPRGIQNYRSISSPVIIDGLAIAPYSRGRSLTAVRLGGKGDVTSSHVAWTTDGPAADVPTPVAHDGLLYLCTDRGQVAVVKAKTGEVLAEASAPRSRTNYSSSPVLADEHLYITNESGVTHVFKYADSKLTHVAQNEVEDFTVATPIFSDGRIYLRTDGHLFCFGK